MQIAYDYMFPIQSENGIKYHKVSYKMNPSMYINDATTTTNDWNNCLIHYGTKIKQNMENVICQKLWHNYEDDTVTGYYQWNIANTATTFYRVLTTGDGYCLSDSDWVTTPPKPLTISERLRQIIQSRHAPAIIIRSNRQAVKAQVELREQRARETLRSILGDERFRRFVCNGFVSVQAKSGRTYQIYPGHGMTIVYDRGKPIEKLCVVLRGDFAPTDSLITRYLMILNDEQQFRTFANIHQASPRVRHSTRQVDSRSLPQILAGLKAAA